MKALRLIVALDGFGRLLERAGDKLQHWACERGDKLIHFSDRIAGGKS